MANEHDVFEPDWASAPGDTITDVLAERGLSRIEFSKRMGQSLDQVSDLLQGRSTITIGIARELEKVIGGSVEFWMSRDFQYRQDTMRLHGADETWLNELPIGDMIKFGWLKPVPKPSEELAECLRFFNVPSVSAWRQAYANVQELVAFRTSPSFDSRPAAVATWLRQGEIEGSAIYCESWDPSRFQASLDKIRPLTREKDPNRFISEMQGLCAAGGVAAAVVRAPNGCRASGATRFLSPEKALLMLSFRYLSDDQFWFSFFHEAGHLLLHGERGLILEGIDSTSAAEEREANEFAANILIGHENQKELLRLPLDGRAVMKFARHIGISPGIVVGQLQYHGKITHRQLNNLKRRFVWET